jgi:hypothetical protein
MTSRTISFSDQDALLLSIVIGVLGKEETPRSRNWIFNKLHGSPSLRLVDVTSDNEAKPLSIFSRIFDQIQKNTDEVEDMRLKSLLSRAVGAELLESCDKGQSFAVTQRGRGWSLGAYRRAGETVDTMQEEILFACLICIVLFEHGAPISEEELLPLAASESLLKVRPGSRLESVQKRLEASGHSGLSRGLTFGTSRGWIQSLDHRLHLTSLGRTEGIYYFD